MTIIIYIDINTEILMKPISNNFLSTALII